MNPNTLSTTPPPLPNCEMAATGTNDSSPQDIVSLYTRILRWVGAITLAAAALCFLISGWAEGPPLLRTGGFLAFTAILTAAGAFCTYRWSDDKGARTFLALAAAFIPANFAQLGALIHAQLATGLSARQGFQQVFIFEPVGNTALALSMLISLAVLIPVAMLGFKALARVGSGQMTLLYLSANMLLLLPLRDPNSVALIGALATAAIIATDWRWLAGQTGLKTWDGTAMRSLLHLPVALMITRNLVMYPASEALISLVCALGSVLLFLGMPRILPSPWMKVASQHCAYGFGLIAWVFLLSGLFDQFRAIPQAMELPLIVLPWCIAVFALTLVAHGSGAVTRGLVSVLAAIICWINLDSAGHLGYSPALITLCTGTLLLLVAFLLEEKAVLLSGATAMLVGIGYHLHYALSLVQQNLWISLAITGTAVILASSALERHGSALRRHASNLRQLWKDWN